MQQHQQEHIYQLEKMKKKKKKKEQNLIKININRKINFHRK